MMQWRSQLIDCPGTVYITEIFPLYLKCCSFYQDHSILFAQEVCPGNQLAGYATAMMFCGLHFATPNQQWSGLYFLLLLHDSLKKVFQNDLKSTKDQAHE